VLVVRTVTDELRRKKGAIQKLIRPKAPSDHGKLIIGERQVIDVLPKRTIKTIVLHAKLE